MQSYFPLAPGAFKVRGAEQEQLHQQAAGITQAQFGKKVFVRAVVEISNFCRENCHYCGMRRDNKQLARFRARVDELAELLVHHRPASVTDVNIQAGEDPIAVREIALPLIKILREQTPLGISVCLGSLSTSLYEQLRAAGAAIYIIKFETGNERLYSELEAPGKFQQRLENIRWLGTNGWNVSSGFICGLPGETETSLLKNFEVAASLPLDGCSVSPFIPGEETPLAKAPVADIDLTLNCMAALRIMRPDWVIPAVSALNLAAQDGGYRRGLRTGANLVTINMTPSAVRGDYLLYKRNRFIMNEERVLSAIAAEGLMPSTTSLVSHFQKKAERLLQPS